MKRIGSVGLNIVGAICFLAVLAVVSSRLERAADYPSLEPAPSKGLSTMPDPTPVTPAVPTAPPGTPGVMISRGTWRAWEPCPARKDAPQAVANLRSRHPDWWQQGPTPTDGSKRAASSLLIQFGHDVRGEFVPAETLDTIPIPGDA